MSGASNQDVTGSAPPEPGAPNRAPSDLTREYATEAIRVQWFASRCIHAGECIRTAPRAFDPRRRPWIKVSESDTDTIAEAVRRCPTGALQYERLDGGAAEPIPRAIEVVAVRNGPYLIRGDIEIVDEQGTLIRRDTRVALCRCGQSRHKPFCDNTHRAIGFRADASGD